jgi:cytoskeletal protein CcmA (bactofilin family)
MGRSPRVESNEQKPAQAEQQPAQARTPAQAPAQTYEPQPRAAATPPTPPAASAAPSAPRAVTESEALARDLREGVVCGFVGAGTVVSGDAEFKGMLRIDGHFSGRVRSEKGALIVSAGGVVEADIEVASAKINGTVNGDITATGRIEFGRSARVRGNIQTPALVVEDGAIFEGTCRMTQPKAQPAAKPKAEESRHAPAAARPAPPAAKPAPAQAVQPAGVGNSAPHAASVTPSSPEPTA